MPASCLVFGLVVYALFKLTTAADVSSRIVRADGGGHMEIGSAAAAQSNLAGKLVRKPVDKQSALPLVQNVAVGSAKGNQSEALHLSKPMPLTQAKPGKRVFLKPQRTLPSNYSSIQGIWKKDFPANDFGCKTSWYDDNYDDGSPVCPGGTLEVHLGSEESLNAEARVASGTLNGVSCMNCTRFGDALGGKLYIGKTFKASCTNSEGMSKLEDAFGLLVDGSAKLTFEDDGTLAVEADADADNVSYKWTPGKFGRMAWTIYQEDLCGGLCDTRYVLADETDDYSKEQNGAVWFTTTNYYETGSGTCEIFLGDKAKSGSRRVCRPATLLAAACAAAFLWSTLGSG
mmetsp:Transcript_122457/g.236084  ORF Transcript_122457/g.236084 Transcript_122457/m.236084 type:complete len:344 (+) Transcript_122457:68-1099(+)